jgi:CheY-like chemotaxis protein
VRGALGQLLIQQGVIDAAGLSDALARQSGHHPVASELYALGYASERELCLALSMQTGWEALVFDESTIRLDVLEEVTSDWARSFSALVVYEDAATLVVAAARPEDAIVPARELAASRGKTVELKIALDITLARTIRVAFKRYMLGDTYLVGREATRQTAHLSIVSPDGGAHHEHRLAQRALAEEAVRAIEHDDELPGANISGEWQASTFITTPNETTDREQPLDDDLIVSELDKISGHDAASSRPRALVVDPDPPGRIQLVTELERLGYECQAAGTAAQAVELMSSVVFDLVFADIATPELDGLRMCRMVKRSKRLARTKVVVTTSVLDSGQVADAELQQYGADGYLEKPLDTRRVHRLLRDLSTEQPGDREAILADALACYRAGDLEGAISRLRDALVVDLANPKLHFMLANMLQRASRWDEAIDEYEAVVELQPQYFPALTRLAYLYFRQGLHARAVETWRRALPVCDDAALRRNIELFMRKLVADMRKTAAPAG